MPEYILPLDAADAGLARVGGKGANLARLARAGLPVPGGFLITTDAYRAFVAANGLEGAIDAALAGLDPGDPHALEAASTRMRAAFTAADWPAELAAALDAAHTPWVDRPLAVRSSATAEDLPDLSFAGQQDTFLHIVGADPFRQAVRDCWSSLWTARAIGYRARNAIAHDHIALAVVVQAMVASEVSGVLFTANPLTGGRDEWVVDATLGLGEALVTGHVEPDHLVIDAATGRVKAQTVGAKAVAIRGRPGGGTETVAVDAADRPALTPEALAALVGLGRQVDALYDAPQDIEWAWADGAIYLLQSRPITTLYPTPDGVPPSPRRLFFSFAAVQGVPEPITPLGRATLMAMFAAGGRIFGFHADWRSQRVVVTAGERLFINMTPLFRNTVGRRLLKGGLGLIEPGAAASLATLEDDLALAPGRPRPRTLLRLARLAPPTLFRLAHGFIRPAAGRRRFQALLADAVARVRAESAAAVGLAAQLAVYERTLSDFFPRTFGRAIPMIGAGLLSFNALNRIAARVGRPEDGLLVARALPHNVTTEMDLALWAAAVAIGRDPAARRAFDTADASALAADYLAGRLPPAAQAAVADFLDRYGARGVGEIDFGRPRWRDDPTPVFQVLASYLALDDPTRAPTAVFGRGEAEARAAIDRIVAAVARSRGGRLKAALVRLMASRARALAGLRESPKFHAINILGTLRAGLLDAAETLVAAGVLDRADDVMFLFPDELKAVAAGEGRDWRVLVAERRAANAREMRRRQLPRLLLSDGRAFYEGVGATAIDDGDGLVGSAVSPGVAEGVVHVIFDPHSARLAPGEILVCPGTDPAWTPLFLAAGGLVMETGGMMTHGAVVAREYGIPAVVGVHQATTRLRTGQQVRVDGSAGRVTPLA